MKTVCENCDYFHAFGDRAKCLLTQKDITRMRKDRCYTFKFQKKNVKVRQRPANDQNTRIT